ncbi:MAG: hypothetical protein WBV82_13890 [Myxococcaceae bacterium]
MVNPTIETDSKGKLHMVYPAYAIGDAFYSTCSGNCTDPEQVKSVKLPTQGTVANAMIALDASDRPHVLLSTFQRVYYAACTGDCTQPGAWTVSVVLEHGSDREVTGEAFAVTPDGKPRFLMHTYRAFAGIGQKPPATFYVTCDANCGSSGSWTSSQIAEETWQESTLRLSAQGHPRVSTVASLEDATTGQTRDMAAYLECNDGQCTSGDAWIGVALYDSFSDPYVQMIDPAVSLALTKAGTPRVLVLGKNENAEKNLVYFACDQNCTDGNSWQGSILLESENIGAGLDLALDGQDRPRFVYTAQSNILLAHCDENCAGPESPWDLTKVAFGQDIPADDIFLYPNCTVAAWFLSHPSLTLGKDGLPRVAYRIEDISGSGPTTPDPTKPQCKAGADMTLVRYSQLPYVKQ